MTHKEFNRIFDHTILKPSTTDVALRLICEDTYQQLCHIFEKM